MSDDNKPTLETGSYEEVLKRMTEEAEWAIQQEIELIQLGQSRYDFLTMQWKSRQLQIEEREKLIRDFRKIRRGYGN